MVKMIKKMMRIFPMNPNPVCVSFGRSFKTSAPRRDMHYASWITLRVINNLRSSTALCAAVDIK